MAASEPTQTRRSQVLAGETALASFLDKVASVLSEHATTVHTAQRALDGSPWGAYVAGEADRVAARAAAKAAAREALKDSAA